MCFVRRGGDYRFVVFFFATALPSAFTLIVARTVPEDEEVRDAATAMRVRLAGLATAFTVREDADVPVVFALAGLALVSGLPAAFTGRKLPCAVVGI